MKKWIAAIAAAAVMALTPATALAGKDTAPGQVIKTACDGASYGQIVSSFTPGFSQGQHAKGAGLKPGANSFVNTEGSLAIHGCANGDS